MASKESDLKEIAALWKNKDKNGKTYYAGKLTLDGKTLDLLIFGKNEDSSEGSPDYKFYIKEPEAKKGKTSKGKKDGKSRAANDGDDIDF